MKFVYVTDSHIGGKNFSGWQMQPRYSESADALIRALDEVVRRENASMVIHGGDITDNGTADEIRKSAEIFEKYLSVPVYAVLGNHDITETNCDELFLANGGKFFPAGQIDHTMIIDGFRFDFLSLWWGANSRSWVKSEGQLISMSQEQHQMLRSGRQDLPRIMVMHAQIRAMMPEKSKLDYPLLEPENDFRKTGDALIEEFHPILILSGHNHLNLAEKIDGTMAVSGTALSETPFECRVFEITQNTISMKTVSLEPILGFKGDYIIEQSYVQGTAPDREFKVNF